MNYEEIHIRVAGVVQGVGFRYFVYRKAEGLGLTGFVRNLEDGSVEIFAQGPRGLLEELLVQVKTGPRSSDVRKVDVSWSAKPGNYHSFEIH